MNQIVPHDPQTGELMPVTTPADTMVGQLVKAEIDTQIATSRAYPRSIARASQNIKSLVSISQEAAEECNYALPRGGKPITGPSVRLAEIVASQWGNCRVSARVVHVDRFEKYLEAEGVFHDLETNMATSARVRRRIAGRDGRVFNDDMIVVTGNAACSIAKRNAILAGVPKAIWNDAYQFALQTVKGDVKTLPERRDGAFKAFAAFGIKPEQIYEALEIGGAADITLDHITTLVAMHKAIKDGEQTVEDYFPASTKPTPGAARKGTADKLEDIARGGDKPADAKKEPRRKRETAKEQPAEEPQAGPDPVIEEARADGADAAEAGDSRDNVPQQYRDHGEAAVAAWQAGHDGVTQQ